MKKIILLFLITFVPCSLFSAQNAVEKSIAAASTQNRPTSATAAGEQHEFVIANFKTESGVVLPQARVVYGTYGHLNAAKDNVVLLPSHYMANFHGYEWLIGPDRALDPSKLFLVATELFGNGRSSSPSNTPEPFHGPRFPVTTIRDNVEAVHRLLTEELKITHLRAIIGFSMGAQQAFQWAVSYPDFADRLVATSGTAKCYPHGVVRLEGQIAAITPIPPSRTAITPLRPTRDWRLLARYGWAGFIPRSGGAVSCGAPVRPRTILLTNTSSTGARTSSPAPTPTTSSSRCVPGRNTTSAPRPASTAT